MAMFSKFPNELKAWKINSVISNNKNNEIFKVSKTDFDGTVVNGVLKHIALHGEKYNAENAQFLCDEANFLKSIPKLGNKFTYLEIFADNNPAKGKADLYIITEDLKPLSEVIATKSFSTDEIVDFGIQISSIIEVLESKGIYHGNLCPENIFVTKSGSYKLGGFSDFESKITDMSFVAPEIHKKEKADLTTDIYSLGLIMYYMCNEKKLPFENDQISADEATSIRLSGKSLPAPFGDNEKLKSVIVIACQPNNSNRWKNAGNIKNALTSIRAELPAKSGKEEKPNIIVPETTNFEENVFEEYDFDNVQETVETAPIQSAFDDEITESELEATTSVEVTEETDSADATELTDETDKITDDSDFVEVEVDSTTNTSENTTKDKTEEKSEDIIEENVFDEYEVDANSNRFERNFGNKDYGDYFEESNTKESDKTEDDAVENQNGEDAKIETETKPKSAFGKPLSTNTNKDNFDFEDPSYVDVFANVNEFEDTDAKNEKSKKNVAVIVVCILVMLAALGFIAFCIISGIVGNQNPTNDTEQTTTANTTAATTTAPTTAPTTEPTKPKAEVIPVVGYGYGYATELLEAAGFKVEVGKYLYSDTYDAGYVISQTPEGEALAEKGSVITLDVSLGAEEVEETTEEETTQPTTAEQTSNTQSSNYYVLPNSSTTNLNNSQVESLSNDELNIAVNEIYARNGRIFQSASLAEYFNSQSWYEPKYTADEFDKNVNLNQYEQYNINLLITEQKDRGLR